MVEQAEQYFNNGIDFADLGRYAEAVASYDKAIAINPDYAGVWNYRGIALGKLGRHAEAVASFDKAIDFNPNHASALLNCRGFSLSQLGRYEEALASYDKAIDINPDDAELWDARGVVLGKLDRHGQAHASYVRASTLNPNSIKICEGIRNELKELKRYDEAFAANNRVIQLDPMNKSALSEKNELLTKIHLEQQQKREKDDRITLIQRIKEAELFGAIPSSIKDAVQQPDTLQYPDEVIALLSQLEKFLNTAHPQIKLVLSCKQIPLSTWGQVKVSITNEGSAHAKNVTLKFSDVVEVRRVKKGLDVLAGETQQYEISIKTTEWGTIPVDITAIYCDVCEKSYLDTIELDIEVTEKLKMNSTDE